MSLQRPDETLMKRWLLSKNINKHENLLGLSSKRKEKSKDHWQLFAVSEY